MLSYDKIKNDIKILNLKAFEVFTSLYLMERENKENIYKTLLKFNYEFMTTSCLHYLFLAIVYMMQSLQSTSPQIPHDVPLVKV